MLNKSKSNPQENVLYNNILLLSRNELFYTTFNLADTFQNRIHLIFIHISFLFNRIKHSKEQKINEIFYQKVFDLMFKKIELNMRELGFGDVSVNKNMKSLVKTFYNILLSCEKFRKNSIKSDYLFLTRYLVLRDNEKKANNPFIIDYFEKYQAFCFDLSHDSVLRGDFKFNYK